MRPAALTLAALLAAALPASAQTVVAKISAPENVRFTAFSPDGGKVAAALDKDRVTLWALPSGKPLHTISFEKERPERLLFAPGGKHLLILLGSGAIQARDAESGAVLRTFPVDSRRSVLAVSPDGRLLATAGDTPEIYLWDYATGKLLRQFAFEFGQSEDLAFSPDGALLASSGGDANLYLWDTATGQLKTKVSDLLLATFSVTFTPDGKTLLAGGADRSIHFVDAGTGKITRSLPPDKHPIAALLVSPDGRSAAAVCMDASGALRPAPLLLWSLSAGEIVKRIDFSDARPNGGGYAADGRMLYSTAKGHDLTIWSLR